MWQFICASCFSGHNSFFPCMSSGLPSMRHLSAARFQGFDQQSHTYPSRVSPKTIAHNTYRHLITTIIVHQTLSLSGFLSVQHSTEIDDDFLLSFSCTIVYYPWGTIKTAIRQPTTTDVEVNESQPHLNMSINNNCFVYVTFSSMTSCGA